MTGLKASWDIRWGVIPGTVDGSQRIHYTSEDYDNDQEKDWKPGDLSRFEMKRLEALGITQAMQNGSLTNWVMTEFIWY